MHSKKHVAGPGRESEKAGEKRRRRWQGFGLAVGGFVAGSIVAPIGVNVISGLPVWANRASDIAVAASWPVLDTCDPSTAIAGSGEPPVGDLGQSERTARAGETGGGAWNRGNLTLTIVPTGDRQVTVRGIRPRIQPIDERPGWVYAPGGGCGETFVQRFDLDLDHRTMRLVEPPASPSGDGASRPPGEGDAFAIDTETSAQLVVTATACERSVEFWLDISYARPGSSDVFVKEVGPYRVYSGAEVQADAAVAWVGELGGTRRDQALCAE